MNLLYLKYAAEVAECGSISKAAEKLYIDQPNLSRAIKDLEASLGVSIFERSSRGMKLTADGKVFLQYAKNILDQVDAVERIFKSGNAVKQQFSVSVPRASYISEAFAAFSNRFLPKDDFELICKETDAMHTIRNVLHEDHKLGIVRYAEIYDRQYKGLFDEKGLNYELVTEFCRVLTLSGESPAARKAEISAADLAEMTEVVDAEPYAPSLPSEEVKRTELPEAPRRIFVHDRGSCFDLLSANPNTYLWGDPVSERLLRRYGLVQRTCTESKRVYRDVLIYRGDHRLSELEKAFISELCRVKRELF